MNKVLNITGLDATQLAPVVASLKELLATLQVYQANLRGYHWHIRGQFFAPLHAQYEKMYDNAGEKIDEVAERLLQMDVQPENRLSVSVGLSRIQETTLLSDAGKITEELISNLRTLIALEREILQNASEAGDEVTVAIMSDFIREQEKEAWFITATLG